MTGSLLFVATTRGLLQLELSVWQDGGEDRENESEEERVDFSQDQETGSLVEDGAETVVGPVERINCGRAQDVVEVHLCYLREGGGGGESS